jgi:hypothetical protein
MTPLICLEQYFEALYSDGDKVPEDISDTGMLEF